MAASDKVFAGSIPEFYDRMMVPLIFAPYARDLAQRVASANPKEVLEIAAGTGAVTREMAAQVAADAWLTITDLNQPMLDYAKTQQPDERITWKQADALALPFEDESFDAVVCQFGVMFFPDKVLGFKEARRVLEPGGRFFFNVWDRIEDNEFANVIMQALAEVFPDDPPRFMARTPHGYHDVEQIRRELRDAGFSDISIEAVDHRSRAASPRDPAVAYCQGTPWRNEIEARDATRLEEATDRAAEAIAHRFGNGAVDGRIRAFVIEAKR